MESQILSMPLDELKLRVSLAERLAVASSVAAAAGPIPTPKIELSEAEATAKVEAAATTAKGGRKGKTDAPKEEPKTEAPKTEAPKEEPKPKEKPKSDASEADLRDQVSEIIAAIRSEFKEAGVEAVRRVVSEYGYEKSKDVHPEQLSEFISDLKLAKDALSNGGKSNMDMDDDV